MPKFVVKVAAATAIVCLALAPVTGIAKADTAECGPGKFAVGGYGAVDKVPDGYTPIYTPGGIFSHEAGGFNKGQTEGAANMIEAVETYAETCPTGEIHLSGYSYGAGIVHTAVGHIDGQTYAPRVHVELAGNPRHPGGVEDTIPGSTILPGLTFRGAGLTPTNVATFTDACNTGSDAICHMPFPWNDPLGSVGGLVGYLSGGHRY